MTGVHPKVVAAAHGAGWSALVIATLEQTVWHGQPSPLAAQVLQAVVPAAGALIAGWFRRVPATSPTVGSNSTSEEMISMSALSDLLDKVHDVFEKELGALKAEFGPGSQVATQVDQALTNAKAQGQQLLTEAEQDAKADAGQLEQDAAKDVATAATSTSTTPAEPAAETTQQS